MRKIGIISMNTELAFHTHTKKESCIVNMQA